PIPTRGAEEHRAEILPKAGRSNSMLKRLYAQRGASKAAAGLAFVVILFCLVAGLVDILSRRPTLTEAPGRRMSRTAPDDALVAQGRYLAPVGNCISCHTRKGGSPFAGGVAFKTPFGTIYSTNITPDADTGIGSWSEEDLVRTMRQGKAPGGRHLYPAFP